MGDIADDHLAGLCCEECGIYFEEEHGHPVLCADCWTPKSKTPKSEYPEIGADDDETLEEKEAKR